MSELVMFRFGVVMLNEAVLPLVATLELIIFTGSEELIKTVLGFSISLSLNSTLPYP